MSKTPKIKQLEMFRKGSKSYGGELLKTRKGRAHARPLDTKHTMHLVLRSSKAIGDWSFKKRHNQIKIDGIIKKFAARYGIRIHSLANVGNHLHLHIKLANRNTYKPFIRATTAAIAMAVTGVSRWNPKALSNIGVSPLQVPQTQSISHPKASGTKAPSRFWDYRPFTRVVTGLRAYLSLKDYIAINELEGLGTQRVEARWIIALNKFRYNTS